MPKSSPAPFRFVGTQADGLPRKRLQTQKACEECRRRKRRCQHLENPATNSNLSENSATNHSQCPDTTSDTPGASESISTGTASNGLTSPDPPVDRITNVPVVLGVDTRPGPQRDTPGNIDHSVKLVKRTFVGDLDPESVFLQNQKSSHDHGIGVWSAEPRLHSTHETSSIADSHHVPYIASGSPIVFDRLLTPHLKEQCLSLLPSEVDHAASCSAYRAKIHPILPVIDFDEYVAMPSDTPASIILRQGISLIAAKQASMGPGLRLLGDPHTSSLTKSSDQIFSAMRTCLSLGMLSDHKQLAQAYGLLYIYAQGTESADVSDEFCTLAIHHSMTMGLHLDWTGADAANLETQFCSFWALDILNGAFNGRPVHMHERDIGRDLESAIERQEPCLRLFLRVVQVLDKVIQAYRPSRKRDSVLPLRIEPSPSYEQLIMSAGAARIDMTQLATIEVLHNAIIILSCREGRDVLLTSAMSDRRDLAALRISTLVGDNPTKTLIMLPFIPYAVSLSLSVSYRNMRRSQIPVYQLRALKKMRADCQILQKLRPIFGAASNFADSVMRMIEGMDVNLTNMSASHRGGPEATASELVADVPATSIHDNSEASSTQWPSGWEADLFDMSFLDQVDDFDFFGNLGSDIDLSSIDDMVHSFVDANPS